MNTPKLKFIVVVDVVVVVDAVDDVN